MPRCGSAAGERDEDVGRSIQRRGWIADPLEWGDGGERVAGDAIGETEISECCDGGVRVEAGGGEQDGEPSRRGLAGQFRSIAVGVMKPTKWASPRAQLETVSFSTAR